MGARDVVVVLVVEVVVGEWGRKLAATRDHGLMLCDSKPSPSIKK